MSCSAEANNNKEFTINAVLTASGPLFEGSNTFQTEISSNIADYIEENKIKEDEIVDITLTSASAALEGYDNLNLLSSISLQVFSDNFPMQNIAFVNGIEDNAAEVKLKVADLQEELKSILFEDHCYIIADGNIKEELDDDLSLGMELVFSINYYKQ